MPLFVASIVEFIQRLLGATLRSISLEVRSYPSNP